MPEVPQLVSSKAGTTARPISFRDGAIDHDEPSSMQAVSLRLHLLPLSSDGSDPSLCWELTRAENLEEMEGCWELENDNFSGFRIRL